MRFARKQVCLQLLSDVCVCCPVSQSAVCPVLQYAGCRSSCRSLVIAVLWVFAVRLVLASCVVVRFLH